MDHSDPVTVFELTDHNRAEILKNALTAEGIRCALAGIEQANTAGLPGTVIMVQVPADQADHARKIITALEENRIKHGH